MEKFDNLKSPLGTFIFPAFHYINSENDRSKIIPGHETSPVMPASQRISLETNVIPEAYEKPPPQKHHHQHHRHHSGMGNHESFLMCPGRRPVKIGSTQPVSISIYFDNFVKRNSNDNGDNDEIYLRIKEGEIEANNNNYNNHRNHHANNHINGYHNKLMNDENTSKAAAEITSDNNNKGGDRIKNNLIKNNNHGHNNNNNCAEGEEDGDVKHFINIYHWIVHSAGDESAATSGDGVRAKKPKIVVRSSNRAL